MKHLSKHLSFANVISCIALFVALSGAAYAATTLGKNSVKTQNIANGSVTTLKLRSGSVTNLKLRNGAVTGAKIAHGDDRLEPAREAASIRSEQLGGGRRHHRQAEERRGDRRKARRQRASAANQLARQLRVHRQDPGRKR